MNRDFLKEAIADAKAVKESAIANAKAALEEAFSPQLKSMLASKLEEMDSSYDEDMTKEAMRGPKFEEDDVKEEAEVSEAKEEVKEDEVTEEMKDKVDEMDLDEILAELERAVADIDGDLVGVSQKWIVATPKSVRVSRKKLSL